MKPTPRWLLTDSLGQSSAGTVRWLRWNRGVTHTVRSRDIAGYATESVNLVYLLDPLYERYGPRGRVWLSKVVDARYQDSVRVSSHTWTTLGEWVRPAWVGREADLRVRLRFALLTASAVHPHGERAVFLRTVPLHNLEEAVRQVEEVCRDACREGAMSQSTSLAAMAVRSAAAFRRGEGHSLDLALRQYSAHAWFGAMAAACACVHLPILADEAVRREWQGIGAPDQTLDAVGV
jgi:hypothetical protein